MEFRDFLRETEGKTKKSAGILPICKETGRILVGFRDDGCWGIWGGGAKNGEEPKQTAIREFKEETQYWGNFHLRYLYASRRPNKTYHNYAAILPEEFEPELNSEHSDFRWCQYQELLDLENKHFGLTALLQNCGPTIERLCNDYHQRTGQKGHRRGQETG